MGKVVKRQRPNDRLELQPTPGIIMLGWRQRLSLRRPQWAPVESQEWRIRSGEWRAETEANASMPPAPKGRSESPIQSPIQTNRKVNSAKDPLTLAYSATECQ